MRIQIYHQKIRSTLWIQVSSSTVNACRRFRVCVIEHMCVYHDASPQLSHSFPAASRGWKRVKPQTSGAPQPIRIVYLASHSRLAEQEHTASHTALQGKPLLSLSLFFHSFKLLWLYPAPSLASLSTLCSSLPIFIALQPDTTFLGYIRSHKLIIAINKSEILWFVYSAVCIFVLESAACISVHNQPLIQSLKHTHMHT